MLPMSQGQTHAHRHDLPAADEPWFSGSESLPAVPPRPPTPADSLPTVPTGGRLPCAPLSAVIRRPPGDLQITVRSGATGPPGLQSTADSDSQAGRRLSATACSDAPPKPMAMACVACWLAGARACGGRPSGQRASALCGRDSVRRRRSRCGLRPVPRRPWPTSAQPSS